MVNMCRSQSLQMCAIYHPSVSVIIPVVSLMFGVHLFVHVDHYIHVHVFIIMQLVY